MLLPNSPVLDPERLAALKATNLMDTPAEEVFDQLTRLACRIMEAPIALVSLVDQERQFFKSCVGPLPEHIQSKREMPLTHSFCRYAVESGRDLIIEDTKSHPLVMENPAVTENGVGAYAGFPLIISSGQILGTLCVLDTKPRQWSQTQLEQLASLASVVSTTIDYRSVAQVKQSKFENLAGAEKDGRTETSLTEAITAYLTHLDEYRRVVERVVTTEELAQEAYWRHQLTATETEMLARIQAYRQQRSKSVRQTDNADALGLAKLVQACEDYFDAQRQRTDAMSRFQRAEISLGEVERTGALMLQAEQALRSFARSYSLRTS